MRHLDHQPFGVILRFGWSVVGGSHSATRLDMAIRSIRNRPFGPKYFQRSSSPNAYALPV